MKPTSSSSPPRWRLILDPAQHGAWNMGIDEALLRTAARSGRPTLRLYGWDGPWLSVGYPQEVSARVLTDCVATGVGVVRRATGGRAVLHGQDLTYAVAMAEEGLQGGSRALYERVADALTAALGDLGVPARRSDSDAPAPGRGVFDCFERPAANEICIGSLKLAGSAQRRYRGAVLQHGSIRLRADSEPCAKAAGLAGQGATSLAEEGCALPEDRLREACVHHFGVSLEADWEARGLDGGELAWVHERVAAHGADPLHRPGVLPEGTAQERPLATDRYS